MNSIFNEDGNYTNGAVEHIIEKQFGDDVYSLFGMLLYYEHSVREISHALTRVVVAIEDRVISERKDDKAS